MTTEVEEGNYERESNEQNDARKVINNQNHQQQQQQNDTYDETDMKFRLRKMFGYCFWVLIALLIQFIVGTQKVFFPDGRDSCSIVTLDDGTSFMRNRAICALEESLKEGIPTLMFLSALVLGGFLIGSVNIWKIRRTSYCALCGATRNLLVNLCSLLSKEEDDKKLLARWAVLGYELSVLKARGFIDSNEGYNYLQSLNLLKGDEWDVMVNGDRHTTIWFWIQTKARELMEEEKLSEHGFQTICNAVTLSRDRANDMMSPIDRDHPQPYVSTCGLLIGINLWFSSIHAGIKWAILFADSNGQIYAEAKMYFEIFMMFFFTSICVMLFDVCTILYNPFGHREIDIKHDVVGAGIRNLAKKLSVCSLPNSSETSDDNSSVYPIRYNEIEVNEVEDKVADKAVSRKVVRYKGSLMSIQKDVLTKSGWR